MLVKQLKLLTFAICAFNADAAQKTPEEYNAEIQGIYSSAMGPADRLDALRNMALQIVLVKSDAVKALREEIVNLNRQLTLAHESTTSTDLEAALQTLKKEKETSDRLAAEKLQSLREELAAALAVTSKIPTLTAELEDARLRAAKIPGITAEKDNISAKVRSLETALNEAAEQLFAVKTEAAKIPSITLERDEARKSLQELANRLAAEQRKNERIPELDSAMQAAKEEHNRSLTTASSRIKELEDDLRFQKERYDKQQSEQERTSSELLELQRQFSATNNTTIRLETENKALKEATVAQQQAQLSADTSLSEMREIMSRLKSENEALQKAIATVKRAAAGRKTDVGTQVALELLPQYGTARRNLIPLRAGLSTTQIQDGSTTNAAKRPSAAPKPAAKRSTASTAVTDDSHVDPEINGEMKVTDPLAAAASSVKVVVTTPFAGLRPAPKQTSIVTTAEQHSSAMRANKSATTANRRNNGTTSNGGKTVKPDAKK
jgi:hypothetical protein